MDSKVIDVIEASWSSYTAEQQKQLALLRSGKARVVVTGQQLGLLGGPLLTLYKILTAVKIAQTRTASGNLTVPVFWLQSEDHDTVEINELNFITDDGGLASTKLNSELLSAQNRIPIGRLGDISELPLLLKGMGLEFQNPTQNIQSLFQSAVQKYFGDLGLLFIDPIKLQASGLTVPVYETALRKSADIEHRLRGKERLMLVEGIDPTVKIRESSPLFFVQTKADNLGRYRLVKSGANFVASESNSSFSEEELLSLLRQSPERFSSSALLRPIVQDTLLNPVAYVGGPAEGRYLELADAAYELFGASRAEFVPRASFLIVEPRVRRAIQKLDGSLTEKLSELSAEEIKEAVTTVAVGPDQEAEVANILNSGLDRIFGALDPLFAELGDPSKQYLAKTKDKFVRGTQGLIDSYRNAFKDRLNRNTKIFGAICDSLAPRGNDQERVLSWYPILNKLGEGFIGTLLDNINLERTSKRTTIIL